MSGNAVETSERVVPSMSDRIVDAGRHAAHLAHEARLAKSLAEDAVEDGVHAARRAVKSVRRGIERLEDVKEEAIHYVKRRPLKTIAMTAAVGFAAGLAVAWIANRFSSNGAAKS
jgi:ElaB/YqjD/DUF883 family membrane-anchored ribosome-binding protein